MKKLFTILATLAVLGVLTAAGFGSAADLQVNGGTIQAGGDADLKLFNKAAISQYYTDGACGDVTGVKVNLWQAAATIFAEEGAWFDVTVCLTDEDGEVISSGTTRKTLSDLVAGAPGYMYLPAYDQTVDPPVPPCQVYDVHITVIGPLNSGTGPDEYLPCP